MSQKYIITWPNGGGDCHHHFKNDCDRTSPSQLKVTLMPQPTFWSTCVIRWVSFTSSLVRIWRLGSSLSGFVSHLRSSRRRGSALPANIAFNQGTLRVPLCLAPKLVQSFGMCFPVVLLSLLCCHLKLNLKLVCFSLITSVAWLLFISYLSHFDLAFFNNFDFG